MAFPRGTHPKDLARLSGNKFYFTGKPCCRGHVCERRTIGGKCLQCEPIRRASITARSPRYFAIKSKADREKNRGERRRAQRERSAKYRLAFLALKELGIEI